MIRHSRTTAAGRGACLLMVLWLAVGCSATPEAEDQPPTEQPAEHHVDPDELADNPCGPDEWDEPPPEVTSLSDSDAESE